MLQAISLEGSGEATPALPDPTLLKRSAVHTAADLGAVLLLGSGALALIALASTAYFLAIEGMVALVF